MNRTKRLQDYGQAIWLDYIRRDMLENGELARLIEEDGVSGVTSNPAIFQKAIGGSTLYDRDLDVCLSDRPEADATELYEEIAVADIRMAADLLESTYRRTQGGDGFVSLEVSPHLARDTQGTLDEVKRLWRRVDRPNLLIKIPATPEGIPAVEEALSEGININITLMFSLEHYEAVAQAYLRALERCPEPQHLASVASFFVSRVDSQVDQKLETIGTEAALALRGKTAVANSKITYRRFQELFRGDAFATQRQRGARVQRVLWASTSTKNPSYRDVLYVEELIGPNTVNTLPPQTLSAFRDHGEVRESLTEGVEEAVTCLDDLAAVGVDLNQETEELQRDGIEKFATPFDRLLETLESKRSTLVAAAGTAG